MKGLQWLYDGALRVLKLNSSWKLLILNLLLDVNQMCLMFVEVGLVARRAVIDTWVSEE